MPMHKPIYKFYHHNHLPIHMSYPGGMMNGGGGKFGGLFGSEMGMGGGGIGGGVGGMDNVMGGFRR
ncbi:hypothetical protein BLA29_015137 [Euroglyphus maynei]|uniref:Uncharacterized protein n=1 Tax=Euroglyphus maynei TaxID=6958 RepID=A0A1Y3BT94_EURMA|nr:hypothetical protein BLA29_015137 [Euroglyphus maynei]